MTTGGPNAETNAHRVSNACASWRPDHEHAECPGTVLGGNLSPSEPCGCWCHRMAPRVEAER
jgi:hypothetical protein